MGVGTVKVDIDRSTTNGTFTNYDIVRGTVSLVCNESLSLSSIEVKLEGVARSELKIPDIRRKKNDKERMRSLVDVHKVLYDSVVVFPPPNVRQVSSAREFTLAPGNYSYSFQFKIPLDSSCVKVGGITNKVSFNKKTKDVVFNNGNFNQKFLMNKAKSYLNQTEGGYQPSSRPSQYHISSQLPPSLSGMDDFASVKYFVKVTCKRSSIFKQNLRSFDPFVFLPLDTDIPQNTPHGILEEEYQEVFVRKEVVFRNRIPEIIGVPASPPPPPERPLQPIAHPMNNSAKKKGFFNKLFDPAATPTSRVITSTNGIRKKNQYEIEAKDVPFAFEIRFRNPAFLIPDTPPNFKLYLISKYKPSRYELAYGEPGESSGLGVVYLQKLVVELVSTTSVSVLEDNGNEKETHNGSHEKIVPICTNVYQNLKFDLKNAKIAKQAGVLTNMPGAGEIYEIEIPQKYFKNCVLPEHLAPSFRTCNISRKYALNIYGGFSSEKIYNFNDTNEINSKVKMVDLQCPNIRVLSGLKLTSSLHSNASWSSSEQHTPPGKPQRPVPPPLSEKHQMMEKMQNVSVASTSNEYQPQPASNGYHGSPVVSQGSPELPSGALPTYDDVVRESSFQDDSEHQRARRRYKQHEMYYVTEP